MISVSEFFWIAGHIGVAFLALLKIDKFLLIISMLFFFILFLNTSQYTDLTVYNSLLQNINGKFHFSFGLVFTARFIDALQIPPILRMPILQLFSILLIVITFIKITKFNIIKLWPVFLTPFIFLTSQNALGQGISLCFIMLAFFAYRERLVYFLLLLLFGISFHASALAFILLFLAAEFVLPALNSLMRGRIRKLRLKSFLFILIILAFFAITIISNLNSIMRLSSYLYNSTDYSNRHPLARLVFIVGLCGLAFISHLIISHQKSQFVFFLILSLGLISLIGFVLNAHELTSRIMFAIYPLSTLMICFCLAENQRQLASIQVLYFAGALNGANLSDLDWLF